MMTRIASQLHDQNCEKFHTQRFDQLCQNDNVVGITKVKRVDTAFFLAQNQLQHNLVGESERTLKVQSGLSGKKDQRV